ncbi:hypothetical protein [Endozoicomonas sp. GU-1]|uniref:hypothetical protein n=1 Tax=Endozoicomonas sp. GU-1 TaxID=3009078 RepID=UPI0022B2C493|nr:hypothetical protein [Endozoicomonas sp. GU-1]WBA80428.1 hypothetical protein O2T12_19115 [Endozoicomonas sp. GU-1]WBA87994.1 hypothetical protein O3276_08325 [Endozoicomonas sp. GU-1]
MLWHRAVFSSTSGVALTGFIVSKLVIAFAPCCPSSACMPGSCSLTGATSLWNFFLTGLLSGVGKSWVKLLEPGLLGSMGGAMGKSFLAKNRKVQKFNLNTECLIYRHF